MDEGIAFRFRTGIPWRELPREQLGPVQTVWKWRRRYASDAPGIACWRRSSRSVRSGEIDAAGAGSGDYQILIGYRGVIDEMSVRRGVEVTYRVGFMIYRDTLPAAIIMCPADQEQACLDELDRPVEELGDAQ